MKKIITLLLSLIALNTFAAERPSAKVETGALQGVFNTT